MAANRQTMGVYDTPEEKAAYAKRSLVYKPLIEEILRRKLTGAELAAQATDGRSALALTLLLDQHPRTIWRNEEAHVAYSHTDPIALALVKEHILPQKLYEDEATGGKRNPTVLTHFGLPLMHNEDIGSQDQALEFFTKMVEWASPARKQLAEMGMPFATGHRAVIERFGRYPYRNDCLGRSWTQEERDWQAEGGASWG